MGAISSIASRPRGRVLAVSAVMISAALIAQGGLTSNASWTEEEWTHGVAGTSDCADPSAAFASRGEGKALGGSLLGIDLDALAEARGVEVTNNGQRSLEATGAATSLGDDAYANPLDVVALSAIDINLGQGLLQLPLNNATGVLGQYARATDAGIAAGASGYVTDNGAIATELDDGYPELATLSLSSLLSSVNPGVSAIIGEVTDVSLVVGALAGRATLDGCDAVWNGAIPFDDNTQTGNLTREYLASYVYTDIESPTIAALGTAVSDVTGSLQTTANGIIGDSGVLSGIVAPVVTLVTSALSLVTSLLGLRVTPGGTTATVTAITLDLSPVQDLLDQPFSDDEGVVSITLSEGTVRVDTAALLAAAYPGDYSAGLNGLEPNSEPLKDPQVLSTLTAKVGALLTSLLSQIDQRLSDALDGAQITAEISIPLQSCPLLCFGAWTDAGALGVTVNGTLAELLADEATVAVDTSVLNALPLGTLLGSIVNALVSGLTATVGSLVGTVVDGILRPLAQLPTNLTSTLVTPIIELVTTVYRELYLNGIVSLTINAQNDPAAGNPEPHDLQTLQEGRYDVAALRVGVLGALSQNDVRLYLARGSVGEVCSPARITAGGCFGY